VNPGAPRQNAVTPIAASDKLAAKFIRGAAATGDARFLVSAITKCVTEAKRGGADHQRRRIDMVLSVIRALPPETRARLKFKR
jgi:hypothetical protein